MPHGEKIVRLLIGIVGTACLAGCGSEPAAGDMQSPPGMAPQITIELPPPPEPMQVKVEGATGPVSYRLLPREPDDIAAAWASVMRTNGFPCDRILSARQLAREDGGGIGIYRIECADGGAYQGTRRANGRLYFRVWTGRL